MQPGVNTNSIGSRFSLRPRTSAGIVVSRSKFISTDKPVSLIRRVFRRQVNGEFEEKVIQSE